MYFVYGYHQKYVNYLSRSNNKSWATMSRIKRDLEDGVNFEPFIWWRVRNRVNQRIQNAGKISAANESTPQDELRFIILLSCTLSTKQNTGNLAASEVITE